MVTSANDDIEESIYLSQSEQEEFFIYYPSQSSSELFDFSIERFCRCVGGSIVVEI